MELPQKVLQQTLWLPAKRERLSRKTCKHQDPGRIIRTVPERTPGIQAQVEGTQVIAAHLQEAVVHTVALLQGGTVLTVVLRQEETVLPTVVHLQEEIVLTADLHLEEIARTVLPPDQEEVVLTVGLLQEVVRRADPAQALQVEALVQAQDRVVLHVLQEEEDKSTAHENLANYSIGTCFP